MTLPTPTSNWTERDLKGRDFGARRPAEPTSFNPEIRGADAEVSDRQDELFASTPSRAADAEAANRRGGLNDIFDAPLTSKADLVENRTDALLDAPLTSKLDGTARGALFDAPLTSKADLERAEAGRRSDAAPDRPLAHAAPMATAGAYSSVTASSPAPALDQDEGFTPAHARAPSRSRGRALMLAAPVGLAAVAAVGFLALSGTGAEEAAAPEALSPAPVPAAPSAEPQPLAGMGVSDLGIATPAAEPVRTVAATPPPPARAETRSAPVRTRTAPAEETAPPPAVAAEPTIVAEPSPAEPTVTAPTTAPEPPIVTEPLPLG